MGKGSRLLGCLVMACALASCDRGDGPTSPSPDQERLRGTVSYRERIALPADAVVDVWLIDVSRQDVAAPVIAQASVRSGGRQVPLPFELVYARGQIDPSHRYAVRATIRVDGRLAFTTDTVVPVLTLGNPSNVDLVLVSVPAAPG